MQNFLGEIIAASRQKKALSQIEFGARYRVTGPAVFKYEGYLTPSLDLWLKMAADAQIPERQAVLLWARNNLPDHFRDYIELPNVALTEAGTEIERSRPLYSFLNVELGR